MSQNDNSASVEKSFSKGIKYSKLKADKVVESNLTEPYFTYLTEIQAGQYIDRTKWSYTLIQLLHFQEFTLVKS